MWILQSGKITSQGKLLLHGPLSVCDVPGQTVMGKTKELQVFLFEQSIIFSEIVGKKTQFTSPQYIYKAHIQVRVLAHQPLTIKRKTLIWVAGESSFAGRFAGRQHFRGHVNGPEKRDFFYGVCVLRPIRRAAEPVGAHGKGYPAIAT